LAQVKLDGSGSYDPDGDPLEYFWYSDANDLIATGAEPNVLLPTGKHTIDLIVNDGIVDSEPNDVVIIVLKANSPPIADAGVDQIAFADIGGLAEVTLDGTGSSDPDGDLLEYFWFNDANDLIATGAEPNVILAVGEHVIDLIVHDGLEDSEPNSCVVTVIEPAEAQMMFVPQTLNLKSCGKYVMAVITLPAGVSVSDLDENEPWRLIPGDIEALFIRTISNKKWQMVFAVFDRQAVIDALQPGQVDVTACSKLETGRTIVGSDTIRVIKPIKLSPNPKPKPKRRILKKQKSK